MTLLAKFPVKKTLLAKYELFSANYMPFPGPILYWKSNPIPYDFFSDTYMSFTYLILHKKLLLHKYELFSANFMPFTYPIPCQKGLVTQYEFFCSSYMLFTGLILHHWSLLSHMSFSMQNRHLYWPNSLSQDLCHLKLSSFYFQFW